MLSMTPGEYGELKAAEKDLARIEEEVRLAEELSARGIPSATAALPAWRRKLNEAMRRRDRARPEE